MLLDQKKASETQKKSKIKATLDQKNDKSDGKSIVTKATMKKLSILVIKINLYKYLIYMNIIAQWLISIKFLLQGQLFP